MNREEIAKALAEKLVASVDVDGMPIISGINAATTAILALRASAAPEEGGIHAMERTNKIAAIIFKHVKGSTHPVFVDRICVSGIDQAATEIAALAPATEEGGREEIAAAVARLRQFADPLDSDYYANETEPNLREDIETVCKAVLSPSPSVGTPEMTSADRKAEA